MKHAGRLVLIVEDEPVYREDLADVCQGYGFNVAISGMVEDGIRKARTLGPTVVLMDVTLPGGCGWAALKRLKSDPQTSGIPVVMMTYPVAPSAPGNAHLLAMAVLTKPITPTTLLETLDRAVSEPSPLA